MLLLPLLSQQPTQRMRNRPLTEARVHSRQSPSTLPTQCGSPTDHNVRPYRECTGGHLWFAGIQMNVYEACLAAKRQALSQLLQPLSWVRFWLCVLMLRYGGVSLCVWICDLYIPSHVYYLGLKYYSRGNKVKILCVCMCVFVL